MKRFKMIDYYVSVVLIAGSVFYGFVKLDASFIAGYFVVGGWQTISMLVHFLTNMFNQKGGKRYQYQKNVLLTAFIITGLTGAAFMHPGIGMLLIVLLFALIVAAPFMAVYYAWICYEETFIKMKRPLDLLK